MSAKQQLLEEEDRAWHELCARFDTLAEGDWERAGAAGEWSAKDLLAHVASWHAEAARFFEQLRSSETPPRWPDIETFNAEVHDKCRQMTLHDVRAMSGAARHRFREELAQVAEPIPEKHVRGIAGCGRDHYQKHLKDLDAFMGSR